MKKHPLVVPVIAVSLVVAVLYVGRTFFGESSFYASLFTDRILVLAASVAKLAALVAAAFSAYAVTMHVGRDNPAWRPWTVFATGLAFYAVGQATLTWYHAVKGNALFPSIADVWFMVAYPLLIVALVGFAVAYARSGFPTAGIVPIAVGMVFTAAALAWPLLRPIAGTPGEPLATALNVAYPSLDLLLLIPAVVLLRITSQFRGGAVWRVWAALLAGVLFLAIGDILFAYFSTLGITKIDPLVHAMYLIAYAGLAAGTEIQYRLVAPEAVPVGAPSLSS